MSYRVTIQFDKTPCEWFTGFFIQSLTSDFWKHFFVGFVLRQVRKQWWISLRHMERFLLNFVWVFELVSWWFRFKTEPLGVCAVRFLETVMLTKAFFYFIRNFTHQSILTQNYTSTSFWTTVNWLSIPFSWNR